MPGFERAYQDYLDARDRQNLRRSLLPVSRGPASEPGRIEINGRTYINFASNDYLGLNRHPALIDATCQWAQKFGAGSGASRLVTGNIEAFRTLEKKVAKFKNKPAALIFPSGFQANATILHALLDARVHGETPLVFFDRFNHASMHFGCWAARLSPIRYDHLDMAHLERLLDAHAANPAPKFILTESIFSMDGDLAHLKHASRLAGMHDALLVVDDAHATGIAGPKGAGLSEHADIVIGTFSKAMGSFGAYVACSELIRDYLINRCTGLIYSTALPPSVLGAIDAALEIVPGMDAERSHVAALAAYFREALRAAGFDTGASSQQIVPVIIGPADKTLEQAEKLRQAGYWCTPIRPPTVPDGTSRLRFTFTADHTQDDVEGLVKALTSVCTPPARADQLGTPV